MAPKEGVEGLMQAIVCNNIKMARRETSGASENKLNQFRPKTNTDKLQRTMHLESNNRSSWAASNREGIELARAKLLTNKAILSCVSFNASNVKLRRWMLNEDDCEPGCASALESKRESDIAKSEIRIVKPIVARDHANKALPEKARSTRGGVGARHVRLLESRKLPKVTSPVTEVGMPCTKPDSVTWW